MEFLYREKFKLTQEEMENEPWQSVATNLEIMEIIAIKEKFDRKAMEREHGKH